MVHELRTGVNKAVAMSALDLIIGDGGKTFYENTFHLDRLFPSTLDWTVFGENAD